MFCAKPKFENCLQVFLFSYMVSTIICRGCVPPSPIANLKNLQIIDAVLKRLHIILYTPKHAFLTHFKDSITLYKIPNPRPNSEPNCLQRHSWHLVRSVHDKK